MNLITINQIFQVYFFRFHKSISSGQLENANNPINSEFQGFQDHFAVKIYALLVTFFNIIYIVKRLINK